MIAVINGVTVMGSPEEIKQYQELNAKTVTHVANLTIDSAKVAMDKALNAKSWSLI